MKLHITGDVVRDDAGWPIGYTPVVMNDAGEILWRSNWKVPDLPSLQRLIEMEAQYMEEMKARMLANLERQSVDSR